MQGKADGEENARLGEKNSRRAEKIERKKRKKGREKEKIKEKSLKQQRKCNFFLQYDDFAVENKGKGQNNEAHNT